MYRTLLATLTILSLTLGVAACGSDSGNSGTGGTGLIGAQGSSVSTGNNSTNTGGACSSACQQVYGCGYCISGADNECVSQTDCVQGCSGDPTQASAASCLSNLNSCGESEIAQCLQ